MVPDITFDLPEVKYGIPFVAEVAAGQRLSTAPSLPTGAAPPSSEGWRRAEPAHHPPEAHTGATVHVEGRLLRADQARPAHPLTANFDVHMPVRTTRPRRPAHRALTSSTADFLAWHKWGYVPYVLAAPIASNTPSISSTAAKCWPLRRRCPRRRSAGGESIAAADPPQFDLQLAASGQGGGDGHLAADPPSRQPLSSTARPGRPQGPSPPASRAPSRRSRSRPRTRHRRGRRRTWPKRSFPA